MELIEFITVIFKNLRKIILYAFCAGFFMFLLATVLPKKYTAKAVAVLAPGASSGGMSVSSIVSDMPIPSFLKSGFGGKGDQVDVIQSIIDSDHLRYKLIFHFKYDSIYSGRFSKKRKAKEILLRQFNKNIRTEISDQDAILITTKDKSPQRAADVANYAIMLTDSMLNKLTTEDAKKRTEFFEKQIQLQKLRLNAAEDAIREFQEEHKLAMPKEQAAATVDATVEIDAKVVSAEIQLNLLRQKYQNNHSKVVESAKYLQQLKRKRRQMISSAPDNVLFPLGDVPKTMVEFGRLMRDYHIQQAVYKTLIPELETSKLEQFKNIPTIQFIEKAEPAERRSYPPRFVWTMLGLGLGFCFSLSFICFSQYRRFVSQSNPEQANKIQNLLNSILSVIKFGDRP